MDLPQYRYAHVRHDGSIAGIITGTQLFVEITEDDGPVDDVTHYVDVTTKRIQPCKDLQTTHSIDGLTVALTQLPAGIGVSANGMQIRTDDEPLLITFDVPGTYSIELTGGVEYMDTALEVSVGDP